jgi:hypothetical protein
LILKYRIERRRALHWLEQRFFAWRDFDRRAMNNKVVERNRP